MIKTIYSKSKNINYFLYPMFIDYTTIPKQSKSYDHIHNVYHIVYIIDGMGALCINNKKIELNASDVILINPKQKHIFETKGENLHYFAFNFYLFDICQKEQFVNENACDEKLQDLFELTIIDNKIQYEKNNFSKIMAEIKMHYNSINVLIKINNIKNMDEMINDYFINSIVDLFTILFSYTNKYNKSMYNAISNEVIIYLEKNINEKLSLELLSKKLGYSKNYLCKKFKESIEMTIGEYFNLLKINKSMELLKLRETAITQIAYELGFSSTQHFSKLFKNLTGYTPSEYKKII